MPDILLTTLNARYAHAAFGLRYLMANLDDLEHRAAVLEFDISRRPVDVLDAILAQQPRIVGLGVYIWNVVPATELAAMLKRLRPDITLVVGGPEVSFETEQQEICRLADYVITGEADLAFAQLCRALLAGKRPAGRIIAAPLPRFDGPGALHLPYHLYSDQDIAHRVIYVEASRGCPFSCEFCLSSLDIPVRGVPLEPFLAVMQSLLDRGARMFKFVDRTFNLNIATAGAILQFFLERWRDGMFLHLEMIPDRLPDELRELVARFPPGGLQFEVGIQTFNPEVAARISRRQDNAKAEENLRFLRQHTGVHIHADLIAGLPGEDIQSFAAGFDRLVKLDVQEIQVGILKRLRGAPIARHDQQWSMIYSPHPPYEVLETKLIDFAAMQRLRRFARYWDLVCNSGNFPATAALLKEGPSPFRSFMRLGEWLYEQTGQTHGIARWRLAELLGTYLTSAGGYNAATVAAAISQDLERRRPPAKHAQRQARHAIIRADKGAG